jgi:hypothetical protein
LSGAIGTAAAGKVDVLDADAAPGAATRATVRVGLSDAADAIAAAGSWAGNGQSKARGDAVMVAVEPVQAWYDARRMSLIINESCCISLIISISLIIRRIH